jgi:hypothetical protein
MMVLDHVGDQEAMVYAQLGQQPLVRTTATSLEPRRGTLSCLSARPPDLAFWTGTRPQVVSMFLSIVPFLHSKRTAAARSLVSLSKSERFVAVSSTPAVEPSSTSALNTVRYVKSHAKSKAVPTGRTHTLKYTHTRDTTHLTRAHRPHTPHASQRHDHVPQPERLCAYKVILSLTVRHMHHGFTGT